jgi:hypothetical protein
MEPLRDSKLLFIAILHDTRELVYDWPILVSGKDEKEAREKVINHIDQLPKDIQEPNYKLSYMIHFDDIETLL